jgi:hypothetical protein
MEEGPRAPLVAAPPRGAQQQPAPPGARAKRKPHFMYDELVDARCAAALAAQPRRSAAPRG